MFKSIDYPTPGGEYGPTLKGFPFYKETEMRQILLLGVSAALSVCATSALADCSLATCDASKGATTCEREIATYNLCLDREAQARWSAANVGKPNSGGTGDVKTAATSIKPDAPASRELEAKPEAAAPRKQEAASSAS